MAKRTTDDELLVEGTMAWSDTGVSLAALDADGYFADVTAEHHLKAGAYFAKIHAKRAPVPTQGDLFA